VSVVVATEQLRAAVAGLRSELALPEPDGDEDLAERIEGARRAVVDLEVRAKLHEVALVRLLHIAASEGPAAALLHVADHLIATAGHLSPLEPGDPEAFAAAVGRAQLLEDQTGVLAAAASSRFGVAAGERRGRVVRCVDHTAVDGGRP
jgi:hypothetical protein